MLRSFRGLESNEVIAPTGVGPIAALIREGKRWTDIILGYDVQGRDCAIGKVLDLIVDDQTGDVRYLLVNACGQYSGEGVLLAPQWTHRISWSKRTLYMDFPQQLIQDSPDWPWATPLVREYEARLHDHYGRTAYWVSGEEADKPGHRTRGDNPETSSVA